MIILNRERGQILEIPGDLRGADLRGTILDDRPVQSTVGVPR